MRAECVSVLVPASTPTFLMIFFNSDRNVLLVGATGMINCDITGVLLCFRAAKQVVGQGTVWMH